jgi:hypothetical protein
MNTLLVVRGERERGEPNRMSQMSQMSPEIQFSPGPWFHEPIAAATFQPRTEALFLLRCFFFFDLTFSSILFIFILRHVAGNSPT